MMRSSSGSSRSAGSDGGSHGAGSALDGAVSGDDAVAVGPGFHHPEVRISVLDEGVELGERARVEQELDALSCEQLAPLALPLDRPWRARMCRFLAQPLDRVDPFAGGM